MIWRDDDILFHAGRIDELLLIDDLFQRYGCLHTVAIIASTLTPELGRVIRERGMSAQLHCWAHDDLSIDAAAVAQLPMAITRIEDLIGIRPVVLYPTWNKVSPMLMDAAATLGLAVSWQKISLEQYIRCDGDVAEKVINLHYWDESDARLLETALRISARMLP